MSSTEKNNGLIPSPGSLLFLSDAHLGAFSEEQNHHLEEDLIKLVAFCLKHRIHIFLLGDFFDYWMEYPGNTPPPLGNRILPAFQTYHQTTGYRTLYITGNHDNWTNGYLRNLGFDIEHEYRIMQHDGLHFMLLHGDGLRDPKWNFPRPLMHRLLRNSYFVYLYQWILPPRAGWACMRMFSGSSRKTSKRTIDESRRKFLDSWAKNQILHNDNIQAIIFGHHHYPVLWKQNGNTCMSCGYFGADRTAGLYTRGNFEIVTWDAGSNVFVKKSQVYNTSNDG